MKKLALTAAIVLGLGMASYANGGGLFGQGQATPEQTQSTGLHRDGIFSPNLPTHGESGNQNAPLGCGIAVLIGLGAAYAVAKKHEE